jgi:DNA-binding CsgD family transcriptional regulator
MKLLIVDDDTALVPLRPRGAPCLFIRDAGLVALLIKFFELKWVQAKPWAPPGTPIAEKGNTQRQRVLEALAAGLKDEAIARQQGVSVRTVRRHIAAIMEELGVTTRFAAGVAAVRRGWISRAA